MRHVGQAAASRRLGLQHLTEGSQATRSAFRLDRRIRHETLPEEQLRREEHKAYRVRKYGNTELPLPPLLDPVVHRARMRYTRLEQRLQKDVPMTDFRKELALNPYAQALVGPIRQCKYTKARLPTHFLQRLDPKINQDASSSKVQYHISPDDGKHKVHSKIESSYLMNSTSIFKAAVTSRVSSTLVSPQAAHQAAMLLGKGPASFDVRKHMALDKNMLDMTEQSLLERTQKLLASLRTEHSDLCLNEDAAVSRLAEVFIFVRFNAAAAGFEEIHGKPCYALPRSYPLKDAAAPGTLAISTSEGSDGEAVSGQLVGLTRHQRTTELVLALDRLFTYKELYH